MQKAALELQASINISTATATSVLPISLPMVKRKLCQTRISANSFIAITTAAATTTTPTAIATAIVTETSASSATAAAKISFRSRKIRNVPRPPNSTKKPPTSPLPPPRPLTAAGELAAALSHLRAADPLLSRVIDTHRPLTFQPPRAPFHALSRSILYQQLAIKAAATIYARFASLCGGEAAILPSVVLALTPDQLRKIGVSGRKASYLNDLAQHFHNGTLADDTVVAMDDDTLFSNLTAVRGIGPWSVHMFMIFTLRRPDVLPIGDLSIRKGVQMLYGLKEVPTPLKVEELCEHWRPYRSVGSWYLYRLIEDKGLLVVAPVVFPVVDELPGVGGQVTELQPVVVPVVDEFPGVGGEVTELQPVVAPVVVPVVDELPGVGDEVTELLPVAVPVVVPVVDELPGVGGEVTELLPVAVPVVVPVVDQIPGEGGEVTELLQQPRIVNPIKVNA